MNKYTFTDEGRYIVGFDLGGTLLEEAFPKLHTMSRTHRCRPLKSPSKKADRRSKPTVRVGESNICL